MREIKNKKRYEEVYNYLEGEGLSYDFIRYIVEEFEEFEENEKIDVYTNLSYRMREGTYSYNLYESLEFIKNFYNDIKILIEDHELQGLKLKFYENPEDLHISIMYYVYLIIVNIWDNKKKFNKTIKKSC